VVVGYLVSSKEEQGILQQILLTIGILVITAVYGYVSKVIKKYFLQTALAINKSRDFMDSLSLVNT